MYLKSELHAWKHGSVQHPIPFFFVQQCQCEGEHVEMKSMWQNRSQKQKEKQVKS
ncbi:hypothetical protein Syun_017369 [Stephania yunnanensis]|uniref:Uncharacterized protein n=1 Tax=Stephania yunnanensis TaxID=152371 RepID=A0AAP0P2B4_9MAGN